MSGVAADQSPYRLVTVHDTGLLSGRRGLVSPDGPHGPHLLIGGAREYVLELVPHADVPSGIVAVEVTLSDELGIPSRTAGWRLESIEAADARSVTLEIPIERDPDDVGCDVARTGLVGELIPASSHEAWIRIADVPFRVRDVDLEPGPSSRDARVARIGPRTLIDLQAPGNRVGVDIVILADCSGSMTIDDIAHRGAWITRIDALRMALREMLRHRLLINGRASHLSLMRFDRHVTPHYPPTEGMVELDGNSPRSQVKAFEDAIDMLIPSGGETDIGRALHRAANVLHRHGRHGNEKIIVLVSDGAHWRPSGDDGTGEMVRAVEEPVSLMTHLHRSLGIRIQAVGISSLDAFLARGTYQETPATRPDHSLLRELVKVGGGDPETTGGLDVLQRCFSRLGGGVVHRVPGPLSRMSPPPARLDTAIVAALSAEAATSPEDDRRRTDLQAEMSLLATTVTLEAQRVLGGSLWALQPCSDVLTRRCGRTVNSLEDLVEFMDWTIGAFKPAAHATTLVECPELESWGTLLHDLHEAVPRGGSDLGSIVELCGLSGPVDSRQAQLAVMSLLRNGLSELTKALSLLTPSAPGPHTGSEPEPHEACVYRD